MWGRRSIDKRRETSVPLPGNTGKGNCLCNELYYILGMTCMEWKYRIQECSVTLPWTLYPGDVDYGLLEYIYV